MKSNSEIIILLATYNGEKYISMQLKSIINQTYTNWKLYIRDDGSSDKTLPIIEGFVKADRRINVVSDDLGNLGSCQNFSTLINRFKDEGSYFMFSDQDDVWIPGKIEKTLEEMLRLEVGFGKGHPLLVYTNFTYVDQQLRVIESRKDFSATKVGKLTFSHLLAQNPVYGCTMMINRSLIGLVNTIPAIAENHDYWVALVANAFGEISYLNTPTILYRQHNNNISTNFDDSSLRKRIERNVLQRRIFTDVRYKIMMAQAFRSIYSKYLSERNRRILDEFIQLGNSGNPVSIFKNIRNGVRRQTFGATLLFYSAVLLLRKR